MFKMQHVMIKITMNIMNVTVLIEQIIHYIIQWKDFNIKIVLIVGGNRVMILMHLSQTIYKNVKELIQYVHKLFNL